MQPSDLVEPTREDEQRLTKGGLAGADDRFCRLLQLQLSRLLDEAYTFGDDTDGDAFADMTLSTLFAMGADELDNASHSVAGSRDRVRLALRTDLSDTDRLALACLVLRPLHSALTEPANVLEAAARLRLRHTDLCALVLAWWGNLPQRLILRPALLQNLASFFVIFHAHMRAEDLLAGNPAEEAGKAFWVQSVAFCENSGQTLHAALLARILAAVAQVRCSEAQGRWQAARAATIYQAGCHEA